MELKRSSKIKLKAFAEMYNITEDEAFIKALDIALSFKRTQNKEISIRYLLAKRKFLNR